MSAGGRKENLKMDSREGLWYELHSFTEEDGARQAMVRVPVDSPWFDGHFPGRPVLPGIAQLAMVQDMIAATLPGGGRIAALRRVRFKQAVAPGADLTVVARYCGTPEVAFRILQDAALVCSGVAILADAGIEALV